MRFPWNLRDRGARSQIRSGADELLLFLDGDAVQQARENALECLSRNERDQARYWEGVAREIEGRRVSTAGHSQPYGPDQSAMRERLIELCKHAVALCNDGFTPTRLQLASAIAFQIQHHTDGCPEVRAVVREMVDAMEALRRIEPPAKDEHYSSEAMSVMRRLLLLKDIALDTTDH